MNPFLSVHELMKQSNQLPHTPPSSPSLEFVHAPTVHPLVNSFRDVHVYDYSYQHESYEMNMTREEKIVLMESIRDRMTNPMARSGAEMIMANMDGDANWDRTNNKRAEDLLALISKHLPADLLYLVEEQLQDMVQLGQCAQGRTTRLWQIYLLCKNERASESNSN